MEKCRIKCRKLCRKLFKIIAALPVIFVWLIICSTVYRQFTEITEINFLAVVSSIWFAYAAFMTAWSQHQSFVSDPGQVSADFYKYYSQYINLNYESAPQITDNVNEDGQSVDQSSQHNMLENEKEYKDMVSPEVKSFFKTIRATQCGSCRQWRPERAHHCSICERCVCRMDHHCPWINNCVGYKNHKFFIQFLTQTCFSVGTFLFSHRMDAYNYLFDQMKVKHASAMMLFHYILLFSLQLAVIILTSMHWYLASTNQTTLEMSIGFHDKDNLYDQGCLKNIVQLWGNSITGYLLPTKTVKSNGWSFPKKCGYELINI